MPDTSYSPASIAGDFRDRQLSFSLLMATPTQILPAEPNRVFLLIAAITNSLVVMPRAQLVSGLGIPISSTQAPFILRYSDVGNLLCQPWFAYSAAGVASIYIIDSVYDPKR